MGKHFHQEVIKCWQRLSKEVEESPSLEIFSIWLDKALNNLLWLDLLWPAGWT